MKSTLYPRSLVFIGALLAIASAQGCRRTRDNNNANNGNNANTNGINTRPNTQPANIALDQQAQFAPRAQGTVGESAADHYEIHVNAGERLVVSVDSTAFDPILEVVLPDGNPLVNDDFQGNRQRSQLTVVPTTAGDLKVRVRSYRAGQGGAYRVRAERSQVAQNTNALANPGRNQLNAFQSLGSHAAPFLEYIQPSESRTHHRLPATYPALTPLRAGAEVTATLAASDTALPSGEHADYYSFEGQSGQTVAIAMNSTTMDPYLMVIAPSGQVFADDDSGGTTNAQLSIVLTEAGQYRVIASAARAGVMGSYDLKFNPTQRVVNTQEWYPNQPPVQPTQQPVAVPVAPNGAVGVAAATRQGTLAQGDATLRSGEFVDRYNFNWPVGTTVRVRLESTAFDPYVIVRAPSGQQQDNDDASPSDRNSQLEYTVREAGQHTVQVTSYRPGETGAYNLIIGGGAAGQAVPVPTQPTQPTGTPVQIIPTVQPNQPNQPNQPTNAVGGQTLAGTLAQGDGTRPSGEFADNYTFNFPAGAMIRLEAVSPEFDTFLLVRSPSGTMQQNDDGIPGTTNSALDLVTSEAGAYTVTVSSYRTGETGPYQLFLRAPGAGQVAQGQPVAVVPTTPPNPVQPVQPANQGSLSREIRGSLARGDRTLQSGEFVDGHSVQFRAGESVRIRLDSSAFDTYLIVRPPSGRQLDNDDFVSGNTNSGIDIPSAEAGNYQIQVTSYRPNETGDYVLRMDHGAAGSLPIDNPSNVPPNPNNPTIPVQPSAGGPRVWGVFAGITDYPGGVNDLPECANDAIKMVETLTERGLLTADRRVLLTDGQVTRDAVRQAIRRIGAQAGPQDVFIFFYSGHGGRTNGGSTDQRELDGMDEYIYLTDGQLMDDEMGTLFDGIHARTSLLALDSCYAGGFAKDVITRPGRIGMFSSEEDVTSSVAQQFRAGGFLSHFLRTGMGGEADSDPRDNALTVGELTHYTWRQFAQNVQNEQEGGGAYQHLVVDRGAVGVGQVLWTYPR